MQTIRLGGCACGAVRYAAHGTPKFVSNCHCRDCRRATGAPFSTWLGYDTDQVSWSGERAIFRSSPTVSRGFCAKCGTPLSYSGKHWATETHLLIGTFDVADDLIPTADSSVRDKLSWVQLVSGEG
jgi:hypothetical protein